MTPGMIFYKKKPDQVAEEGRFSKLADILEPIFNIVVYFIFSDSISRKNNLRGLTSIF
jgi:hypothetical protein